MPAKQTRRGEGRIARKVRSLLEARGFVVDFFWFQTPYHSRDCAIWGAYGHDANGDKVDFFSWDAMAKVSQMRCPALSTSYSQRANGFEVFACEEDGEVERGGEDR